jgi:peptide/nickel transport system permease protein
MPGNPVEALLVKFKGRLSPSAVNAISALFGTSHRSLWSSYILYWRDLFSGNLGISFTFFPYTVLWVIRSSIFWTLGLVGISTVISFVIGTLIGIFAGWKRGSWLDHLLPTATFFTAVPYFWLGLLMLYVFGQVVRIFPISGAYSVSMTPGFSLSFIGSIALYGFLPVSTLVLSSVAGWIIQMRNMMITVLGEDFVLMAEAKGLPRRRIIFTYAARNAVLPSIASFALSLGFVVSGALLTEVVFDYPGIGYQLYQAVRNLDYPLMQGIFLMITLCVLAANLFADVLYAVLDPRTRGGRQA